MAKTLSESAAEILKASMNAGKEPAAKLPGEMEDLGGQTPTSLPDDFGHKASAEMKVAAKPGAPGVPAEPMKKLPGSDAKKLADEDEGLKKNPVDTGEYKTEETEVEGEVVAEEDESLEEGKTKLAMPMAVKKLGEEEDEKEDKEEDEEEDEDEEDEKEMKEAWKKSMKEKAHKSMAEDVDALFNGESLSEEFKTKATTIFEAAVNSRVDTILEEIATENEAILAEAVETLKEEMASARIASFSVAISSRIATENEAILAEAVETLNCFTS